ncbi:DUF1707 domain-containing protein [Nocardia puris]|uniref:DUF1707 SHOCT-like domain-containing protein n=1 Tax=Nocardia puris TaxID=208602 RepID=UPI00189615FF|nr:DUF1707 domain-containing protein [Nocardia puris]MBF6215634.1 DUF1707 domain-containing protein [Nocardia puris]
MTPADIRAADADRERVASALASHTGAGRLTLDEFSERVAAAYRARTMGELSVITSDLPALAPPRAAGLTANWSARSLLGVSAAIAVAVAVTGLGAASVAYAGPLMSAWGFGCA